MNTTEISIQYQQMRTTLSKWVDLADSQWEQFASIFQIRTVKKQEYILFPGATVHELYFVC